MKKNKIYEYRSKAGLSQRQLAKLLDIPYQQIQKWESYERMPTAINAVILAKALNTTVEKLFPLDENDNDQ